MVVVLNEAHIILQAQLTLTFVVNCIMFCYHYSPLNIPTYIIFSIIVWGLKIIIDFINYCIRIQNKRIYRRMDKIKYNKIKSGLWNYLFHYTTHKSLLFVFFLFLIWLVDVFVIKLNHHRHFTQLIYFFNMTGWHLIPVYSQFLFIYFLPLIYRYLHVHIWTVVVFSYVNELNNVVMLYFECFGILKLFVDSYC